MKGAVSAFVTTRRLTPLVSPPRPRYDRARVGYLATTGRTEIRTATWSTFAMCGSCKASNGTASPACIDRRSVSSCDSISASSWSNRACLATVKRRCYRSKGWRPVTG